MDLGVVELTPIETAEVKDTIKKPEGVLAAGNVVEVFIGQSDGSVSAIFFPTASDARIYLHTYYGGAQEVVDTENLSLDSHQPFMPKNTYAISQPKEVWTTKPELVSKFSDKVVTAFVDKSPITDEVQQKNLKPQTAMVGIWAEEKDAAAFYQKQGKTVINQTAGGVNPVKRNEVYLQPQVFLKFSQ